MLQYQESLTTLAERYREQKWLLFQQLIALDLVGRLLESTTPLPIRTVICGNPDIRFGQQDVNEAHPLARFFQGREVVDLVLSVAQASKLQHCRCWTSVYGPAEYINAHRDRSGNIQLLICLQSPPSADYGGSLLLRPSTGERQVFLRPGDAVLFEASSIEHETTPLLCTEQTRRIVAVGRFFLNYHR